MPVESQQSERQDPHQPEYDRMREAYLKQPDTKVGDDWSNWEDFEV